MNFSKESLLSCQLQTKQEKEITEQKIIYPQNGVEGSNVLEKPEIFNNTDQIHNLSWQGQYDENKKKDGKWIAFWNNVLLKNIGGYYKEGQKLGLWKELYIKYSNQAQIFEIGGYENCIRIGKWNYIYNNKMIGGGSYNEDGQRQGKWIELDEGFQDCKNVTYFGEYNISGMKVGIWNIMYCKAFQQKYKQIGGGSYDQEGNQKKIGKWVELDENFNHEKQVTYYGEYNLNNIKVGKWVIMLDQGGNREIGGGSYDQEGNQKKIGKWVELDEKFSQKKQITYNGEYNTNNKKVGKWDIMYDRGENGQNIEIGGGSYDQVGNQKKIGKWVELFDGFWSGAQVVYIGEYNMNNIKVGRWDILQYRDNGEVEYQQIGGGSYDQEGNQKKIGKWIELDDKFHYAKQVTYNGEYNMNNIKVGRWDTMYCQYNQMEYQKIGGGSYDQEGNQKKFGKWIELDEEFRYLSQVTYNGEYNKNGLKVGRWDIMFCKIYEKEYKQIGGGSYDQEGNQKKIGKWVELHEGFQYYQQVTFNGEYNMNGIKVGRWDIMYKMYGNWEQKQIGGGSYDEEGNYKKIGKWVELDEKSQNIVQRSFNGQYNMKGQKVDIWVEMYLEDNEIKGETRYYD